jgi:signal transduction histidine kinase
MMMATDSGQGIKSLASFGFDRKINLREWSVNDIVRKTEEVLPQYTNGHIETKMDLCGENPRVLADMARIQEALIHLIRNGVEAMPRGGALTLGTAVVGFPDGPFLSSNHSNACAMFTVADTGSGIDKPFMGKLFEPFFTTKSGTGRGLGLPIAQSIIREHHGAMKVLSVPKRGTTVKVYLPLVRTVLDALAPIPLPPSYSAGAYR